MTRTSLAIFKGGDSDGSIAFAPRFPNTGGVGGTLSETREFVLKGIDLCLQEPQELANFLGSKPQTSINFARLRPDHPKSYFIDWLSIQVPTAEQAVSE